MATTPNLQMPELSAGQEEKELTHNEALRILDALVMANILDKDLTAPPASPQDGDRYIPASTASGAWIGHEEEIAYYKSSSWIFVPPQAGFRVYVVDEDATYIWMDATWQVVDVVVSVNSYDVGCSKEGKPAASEMVLKAAMVRSVRFEDDFSGSQAHSGVAADASSVYSIKKNGAEVGTCTFAASGTTATFATTGGVVDFAAGDVLTIIAPGSQDAALEDVGILLKGLKV